MRNTLICLLIVLAGQTALAAQRTEEFTFPVDSDARFTLDSHRGHITIRTADTDTIQVKATISHRDEEALDRVRIDTSNSRRRVRVEVEFDYQYSPGPFFSWREQGQSPDVDLDIIIPETISLTIDSHRSSMDVQAPAGEVHIKAHRGHGEITGIRSDFGLDTHRGDFDLEIAELHDLDLKTHRGTIHADIEKAGGFRVSGSTHRGRFDFPGKDIEVERGRDWNDISVYHQEGDGESRIYLDSHRGDITLDFRG